MANQLDAFIEELNAFQGVSARHKGDRVSLDVTLDDDPKEALRKIRAVQTHLRLAKKQAVLQTKLIRAEYSAAISSATYRPGLGGALFGAKYRSAARRSGVAEKQRLADERDRAISPYETIKRVVDQFLVMLDQKKAEIQSRTLQT